MRVLGIDPGASGALVVVDNGKISDLIDMPVLNVKRGSRAVREVNAPALGAIVASLQPIDTAMLEQVGAMPGQGVSSMFAFGRAVGVVEGVLGALQIPYTRVPPQEWQRAMRVRGGKDGARERAMALFPVRAADFARKKDDGRADASLIAAYGEQRLATL
jgi:crossover junction endodeoxyribonuclease RuvC